MTTISVGTGVLDGPETMGVDVLHGDAKNLLIAKKILFFENIHPSGTDRRGRRSLRVGMVAVRSIKPTDKSKFEISQGLELCDCTFGVGAPIQSRCCLSEGR